MLWLMCLGLLLVFKGGAVYVEEDCLVQDRLFIERPNPEQASFFAYVQHSGSIFTATRMCTDPQEFLFLSVTSRDVVWEDAFAKSKKQETRKSLRSKERWMKFVFQADALRISDAEGRPWTTKEMSTKCNSFNITVKGVLAKQLCGGAAKWRVTKDRCAHVLLPPASNKTLSVSFMSNMSFVPTLKIENFTTKLVRRNGELDLVKDQRCSGCQPLYGERNVLRFPLPATNQTTRKASPRVLTVCSSSGEPFIVSVRQTQEGEIAPATSNQDAFTVIAMAVVVALTLLSLTEY
ncbi:uncharacterized protein [Penaeus vannamei]|uniref:uncharacterized protein isoform X2 n=1 Tax=Penaeus vannamei TaxID=6689 RepID=UPI00387F7FD3